MAIYYHCVCCNRLFDTSNGYIPNDVRSIGNVIYATITSRNIGKWLCSLCVSLSIRCFRTLR